MKQAKIKLFDTEIIETKITSGYCNFCGQKKQSVQGKFANKIYFVSLMDKKELKWLQEGMFSREKLLWVIDPNYEMITREAFAFICFDCVEQISKLLKNYENSEN